MKQTTSSEPLLADRLTRLHRPLPPDLIDRAIAQAGNEDAVTRTAAAADGSPAPLLGDGRAISELPPPAPQRRWPNSLRLAMTAVTVVAVAGGTWGAIVATSGRNGLTGVTGASGTPAGAAPHVTISTVPSVGMAPTCADLPLGELSGGSTATKFGFLDTETGAFTADPTAPSGSLKPGGPSYLSSMGGWWSPASGAVNDNNMIAVAPDGGGYAYVVPAGGAIDGGTVHITTPTSNSTLITHPPEREILVGWSDEGIVVQRLDTTGDHITGTWVIDPTTGTEREISIPPGGPESPPGNVVAEGNAVWEVIGGEASANGPTTPDTLVRYDLQTGATTTWFDLEGYYVSGGALPAGDLAPDKTGPTTPHIQVLGFDSQGEPLLGIGPATGPIGATIPTGELLLVTGREAVTVIRLAGQPGADANYVQPDGNGIWFSGTDSGPQSVYHWDPSTGWHAVTSLPAHVNLARVVGPCGT
jgi:hypothetical protein